MSLSITDLAAIESIVQKGVQPIKDDLKKIKEDVDLLAGLNQLDEIRKDLRLRKLYVDRDEKSEA